MLDAATGVDDHEARPEPGAVSLCIYCGAVGVFGRDLALRAPTERELDEFARSKQFRKMYTEFGWARQYVMIKESLLRRDRRDPDR